MRQDCPPATCRPAWLWPPRVKRRRSTGIMSAASSGFEGCADGYAAVPQGRECPRPARAASLPPHKAFAPPAQVSPGTALRLCILRAASLCRYFQNNALWRQHSCRRRPRTASRFSIKNGAKTTRNRPIASGIATARIERGVLELLLGAGQSLQGMRRLPRRVFRRAINQSLFKDRHNEVGQACPHAV